MGIEKQPSEEQKKQYEKSEKLGDTRIEEFSAFDEFLHPKEEIKLFTSIKTDSGEGKKILAITGERLISFTSPDTRLLGEKEEFKDLNLESIQEMTVESRKGFDILQVQTRRDTLKFMVPEERGVKISGYIRNYQKDPGE